MRFKNMLMNGSYYVREGEGGTGGGNDPSTETQNNQNNQTQKNNNENNIDIPEDLWSNPEDTTQQQQQNNNNDRQQQQNNDQQQSLDDYFNSMDFTEGVDLSQLTEELQQGNTESLNKAIAKASTNAYKRALLDSNKLMDAKIKQAVDQAVQRSVGTVNQSNAVAAMQAALPFTANKALAPVATAVLQQFMKKGASTNDAIAKVKNFFASTSKLSAKDLGMQVAPKNPSNRRFADNNPSQREDDETDWSKLLTEG